jgi:hypothetical protein
MLPRRRRTPTLAMGFAVGLAIGKINMVDVVRHYDTDRYHLKEIGM